MSKPAVSSTITRSRARESRCCFCTAGSARSRCSGRSCRRSPRSGRSSASTCRATAAPRSASGRSSLIDMGADMAAIVKELGYGTVDVLGYSIGAGVAFQLALQHPEAVRRVVLVSAAFAQTATIPRCCRAGAGRRGDGGDDEGHADVQVVCRGRAAVRRIFRSCSTRMGAFMRTPYDWAEDVKKLDDAGDARLRRQRHVPPGAHRRVLSASRRRPAGRRLAARDHVEEPPRDPARPTHYDIFASPVLRRRCCLSSTAKAVPRTGVTARPGSAKRVAPRSQSRPGRQRICPATRLPALQGGHELLRNRRRTGTLPPKCSGGSK